MPAGWPPRPLPSIDVTDDRLRLRLWEPADAPALASAWGDPLVRRWSNPPDADVEAARRWIEGELERRAKAMALDIVIDVDGVVAGEVGLTQFGVRPGTCAVGFWTAAAHRGRGLAATAVRRVLAWAVETMELTDALATTHPDNIGAIVTLERSGFRVLQATPSQAVYAWTAERPQNPPRM